MEQVQTGGQESALLSILAERKGLQFNEMTKALELPEDALAQQLTLLELDGSVCRRGTVYFTTKKRKG